MPVHGHFLGLWTALLCYGKRRWPNTGPGWLSLWVDHPKNHDLTEARSCGMREPEP
jgi:hypothetical protein